MTDRPSDHAIAQAFWEWSGHHPAWRAKRPAKAWVEMRAAEIDAAAPEGAQPDGMWAGTIPRGVQEALQRMVEDTFGRGQASVDDGRLVQRWAEKINTAPPPPLGGEDGAKDREDAARYRWLRDSSGGLPISAAAARDPTTFDDAIDAARAAGGE